MSVFNVLKKMGKFLKKPWCCVGEGILRQILVLSTELMKQIGHEERMLATSAS